MEENEILLKLNFIFDLVFTKLTSLLWAETISVISSLSAHPLFSCVVTLYTLILLYFPQLFHKAIFSPVLILAGISLLNILRIGAIQSSKHENKEIPAVSGLIQNEESRLIKENREASPAESEPTNSLEQVDQWVTFHSEEGSKSEMGIDPNSSLEGSFVEWNVGAPLEVIPEECEGEEAEKDSIEKTNTQNKDIARCQSRSLYYPESDTDSSSDGEFLAIGEGGSAEGNCLWEEEEREGLIEIPLDWGHKRALEFQVEEENLIEIDISPSRY